MLTINLKLSVYFRHRKLYFQEICTEDDKKNAGFRLLPVSSTHSMIQPSSFVLQIQANGITIVVINWVFDINNDKLIFKIVILFNSKIIFASKI